MKLFRANIIIPLLVLVALGGIIFFQSRSKSSLIETKWLELTNEELGFSFSYPELFNVSQLSEQDIKDEFLFRADQNNPSSHITLKYETRLGLITFMQQGSVLDILLKNLNNRYPDQYPDFKKEKEEKITVDGVEAGQIYFTYLGADNLTRMKQRFVIVTRDYEQKELGKVALYFAFQSKESDFDVLNIDFQKILDSFQFP